MNKEVYKDYYITYNPKHIPTNAFDWEYVHKDYDGAPDAFDMRSGCVASLKDATQAIDELEEE